MMAKNRKPKKKKNNLKIIFILLILVVIVIFGYTIFNKFIVPIWERYTEKLIITKEVPYQEEEREEVLPVPIEEMVEVNLYFSDSQAMYLEPEKRRISQTPSLTRQAVIELIKGPENSELYPTIPQGTQVN
ncbi:MAG: GerMN domain-containing protein, partial [Candidatus Atribacteria bacterium]|nr:GerMN domain-containing protein [Candidatus Atribacteria bacterium]